MALKVSKRMAAARAAVEPGKAYKLDEAIAILKTVPPVKFSQSVEVAIVLGIDAKRSDQGVRGATNLPHGSGKTIRVAVFAQGKQAEAAEAAGADRIGMDDLMQEMQAGQLSYDVVIASPDTMGLVGRLGPVLGPRGLMPNPKVGTVTTDVAQAVRNAKGGQVRFKNDKSGVLHAAIGKVNFSEDHLKDNLRALLADVRRLKPPSSKGIYMKRLVLSSTMGPGVPIDLASVE